MAVPVTTRNLFSVSFVGTTVQTDAAIGKYDTPFYSLHKTQQQAASWYVWKRAGLAAA